MAMAALKSLGLAGARKTLRKLFRRVLPAGGRENGDQLSSSTTATATTTASPSSSPSSSSSTSPSSPVASGSGSGLDQTKLNNNNNNTTSDNTNSNSNSMAPVASRIHLLDEDKENQPPPGHPDHLSQPLAALKLGQDNELATKPASAQEVPIFTDPAVLAERAEHLAFIGEALDMARLALRTNETPVGCVLVHDGKVIAKGMNATNVTRNGTRHAEFMAISALLSYPPRDGPRVTCLKSKTPPVRQQNLSDAASDAASQESEWRCPDEGNEDGSKGHLYPYGQKFHPAERVDRNIIRECILYVTVEPCVMCASLLRQLGIKKVYFGAVNDKFGGTGGVFSIHANSLPIGEDGQTASAHPTPKPIQFPDGGGSLGTSFPPGGGDGGNVEAGYEIEGGWGRDDAVGLLRRFYVQENGRAPIPRKKEGRAARLAAMMEKDGNGAMAEEQDQAGDEMDLLEFDDPMKENIDPCRDDESKPRSSGLRDKGSLANPAAVLREAENYLS